MIYCNAFGSVPDGKVCLVREEYAAKVSNVLLNEKCREWASLAKSKKSEIWTRMTPVGQGEEYILPETHAFIVCFQMLVTFLGIFVHT